MSDHRHRVSDKADSSSPEDIDPGERALDEYRRWRLRIYGSKQIPKIQQMDNLLAMMREEPPA